MSPCGTKRTCRHVYSLSALRGKADIMLPQRPLYGVRCKPLDEIARCLRAAPPRRQLRKKRKTGQSEQHVDQIVQCSRAQLTICRYAANENGQQAPPPLVALLHARPEFRIAGAGGV